MGNNWHNQGATAENIGTTFEVSQMMKRDIVTQEPFIYSSTIVQSMTSDIRKCDHATNGFDLVSHSSEYSNTLRWKGITIFSPMALRRKNLEKCCKLQGRHSMRQFPMLTESKLSHSLRQQSNKKLARLNPHSNK